MDDVPLIMTVFNCHTSNCTLERGPLLFVSGHLRVENLIKGGATVIE